VQWLLQNTAGKHKPSGRNDRICGVLQLDNVHTLTQFSYSVLANLKTLFLACRDKKNIFGLNFSAMSSSENKKL
jgi:hypothetical protein